jgi:hypothetical protein
VGKKPEFHDCIYPRCLTGLQQLRPHDISQLERAESAMSEGTPPPPVPGHYSCGSMLSGARPDEICFPLRQSEFQTLCDGDINDARNRRDWWIALGIGFFVGVGGVMATMVLTDWKADWKSWHMWSIGCILILLVGAFFGSVMTACTLHGRYKHTRGDSAYARLVKEISAWGFRG